MVGCLHADPSRAYLQLNLDLAHVYTVKGDRRTAELLVPETGGGDLTGLGAAPKHAPSKPLTGPWYGVMNRKCSIHFAEKYENSAQVKRNI